MTPIQIECSIFLAVGGLRAVCLYVAVAKLEAREAIPSGDANRKECKKEFNYLNFDLTFILKMYYNDTRIIGGQPIEITSAPWQVAILYSNEFGCGGSVISKCLILTAAHCLMGTPIGTLSIRAGSSRHASGGQVRKISRIILNSEYNAKTSNNDIGIMKLRAPLILNQFITPVGIASDYWPAAGTSCQVTGWGVTRESSENPANKLREVTVQIVSQGKCKWDYNRKRIKITENMICAGATNGGKDACQGDSGGPLVCNKALVGAVSFGDGCGRAEYPGVYTSVAKKSKWIRNVMAKYNNC
ncbi:trypsin beta-like [Episyrphus balteatus]|uniref:trypsin beta-like n=1 Tax=Episyrphus balteatus TaxID=286459 RepID=UPI0024868DD1|nr:trypsin beta-like [Episyrphus balteatus]